MLTPDEEEKLRLEVMKFHNTKVNQHVAYLISLLIGFSTYISRISDIIDFLLTYKFTLVSSIFLSLIPIIYFIIFFIYLLGRTFYWDLLLSLGISFNFLVRYEEARNPDSGFIGSDNKVSSSNNLWRFIHLVSIYFTKLNDIYIRQEKNKDDREKHEPGDADRTYKWKLAYLCRHNRILVRWLALLSASCFGIILGLIITHYARNWILIFLGFGVLYILSHSLYIALRFWRKPLE